jgi:hypothetical protein
MNEEQPDTNETRPAGPPDDDLVHGPESEKAIAPPGQRDPNAEGMPQFVTVLTPMEQQVGVHVINALQHPETVAVLTTVAVGQDGLQRIVSVGLDPAMMEQVQQIVVQAREERTKRVPCVGFHCVLEDRQRDEEQQQKGGDES